MSNPQKEGEATPQEKEHIKRLGDLRKELYRIIEAMREFEGQKPACIADLIVARREAQSARHWLGECLSYFPTGYRVTDNPNDPGSESRG